MNKFNSTNLASHISVYSGFFIFLPHIWPFCQGSSSQHATQPAAELVITKSHPTKSTQQIQHSGAHLALCFTRTPTLGCCSAGRRYVFNIFSGLRLMGHNRAVHVQVEPLQFGAGFGQTHSTLSTRQQQYNNSKPNTDNITGRQQDRNHCAQSTSRQHVVAPGFAFESPSFPTNANIARTDVCCSQYANNTRSGQEAMLHAVLGKHKFVFLFGFV